MTKSIAGDGGKFAKNWQVREESHYNHWVKGEPQNQIQFAFRNHWEVFQLLMKNPLFNNGKRCLETGCGRGSVSGYFSDAGFDCTLLDLSPDVIEIAKNIFAKNGLKAEFEVGDVTKMTFPDGSFDVIYSIGLLEHFNDIESSIREQIRVLSKGGLFIAYIVPKYSENIQKDYDWVNKILKGYVNETNVAPKEEVFRSDTPSPDYLKIMEKHGLGGVEASGIYSVPMISHSIEFPFSLMPDESEKALLDYFKNLMASQKAKSKLHPWLCREGYGQAFLVWGYKK